MTISIDELYDFLTQKIEEYADCATQEFRNGMSEAKTLLMYYCGNKKICYKTKNSSTEL